MTTTQNVKGNRKIVMAAFWCHEVVFKIPDGLDLEDETVVEWWYVKGGSLSIHYVNGEEEKIEYEYGPEIDFKNPTVTEIMDADDYHIEYDEDKE